MANVDTGLGAGLGAEDAAGWGAAAAAAPATGGASLAIYGGAQILGGLIGGVLASGDKKKAEKAYNEAIDIIDSTGAPPDTAREILLEKFRAVGLQSPELENAIDVGVSEMAKYQEDPRFREASVSALQRMMKQAEGGLTAQDRLALRQIEQENQRAVQGKIAQIQQEQQMRGMGGAGAGLAAQLSAAQAGSERGLNSALQVGATSSERALQSLAMGSNLAESLRGRDLGVAQATLGAADEFKRFKAQEAIGRQSRNVAAQNQAVRDYVDREQQSKWRTTASENAEKTRAVEATGTDWDRKYKFNVGRAEMRTGAGDRASKSAAATQQGVGDFATGIAQKAGDYFGNQPVMYDTKTGQALYDPYTGKKYSET